MDAAVQHGSPHSPHPSIRGNMTTSTILPLPPEVIAQIKSSATITSLTVAILGLFQNSLDAQASRIDIEVDFRRGGAVVEDDGLGILPTEFAESGGLGKLYHTSKYKTSLTTYGCHGIFLSSLASLCLLIVTSHHHQHRSTNSLMFHYSKILFRLLPAPASQSLDSRHHGTKVSIRDLFGNMPVRVKQRSLSTEDRSEQERLWESLKQSLVALLTASGRSVALKVKDLATTKSLTISMPKAKTETSWQAETIGPGPPEKLRLPLSILQQTGVISPNTLKSWVPASASSSLIVIKGGISLEPAPSKAIQFISLGIRPLSRSGHNELYDHINRLFSRSRFGTIEPETLTEEEKLRRQRDRRFKQDGLTNKQMSIERGVDRWPMFVLNIFFKGERSRLSSELLVENDAKLASVINVLDALITGWLSSNHFLPSKRKDKHQDSSSESDSQSVAPPRPTASDDEISRIRTVRLAHRGKRPRSKQRIGSPSRSYTGVTSMNELSRIKSSNQFLVGKVWSQTPEIKKALTAPSNKGDIDNGLQSQEFQRAKSGPNRAAFISQLSRENGLLQDLDTDIRKNDCPLEEQQGFGLQQDDVVDWIDPITKQSHLINSRTGAIVVPETIKSTHGAGAINPHAKNIFTRSLRLPPKNSSTDQSSEPGGWLDGVLQNWQNPVFPCAERSIQQASLYIPGEETGAASAGKFDLKTAGQIEKAFKEVSHLNASKITKEALKNAEVIAQVAEKFILVALQTGQGDAEKIERSMLVIIDQHAADERCKVEQLLDEMSQPLSGNDNVYTSALGHNSQIRTSLLEKPLTFHISPREADLFEHHAWSFAKWGVLYDLGSSLNPKEINAQQSESRNLIVRSFPLVIFSRCTLEPKILISLLRTELWNLVENATKIATSGRQNPNPDEGWVCRISYFPQGLLDMVNSRACRSAIMFNDTLSKKECEDLVQRLAKCAFPFQCAHGRPSMVPLLDLGSLKTEADANGFWSGTFVEKKEEEVGWDFVKTFQKWQDGSQARSEREGGE